MPEKLLVTGGAGFIGSCFIRQLAADSDTHTINLDKLTYAGCLDSIAMVTTAQSTFVQGDIADRQLVAKLLQQHRPQAIVHFAAESHVDRSIDGPLTFVQTNVMGTAVLLDAASEYWHSLPRADAARFRFVHVSTDEVFGSIAAGSFTENSRYQPSSPYAASKAAADHLVRAYQLTYGLPTIVTNCSNNYGPYQLPEKLIPLMILNAIEGRPLPVYGDGQNVRDWIYVEDHCQAIERIRSRGRVGETYNIGGNCEQSNLSVVESICRIVQSQLPQLAHRCSDLIEHVADRPGHDRRYAMDSTKLRTELDWQPQTSFDAGLARTVQWYVDNTEWLQRIVARDCHRQRLGVGRGESKHA